MWCVQRILYDLATRSRWQTRVSKRAYTIMVEITELSLDIGLYYFHGAFFGRCCWRNLFWRFFSNSTTVRFAKPNHGKYDSTWVRCTRNTEQVFDRKFSLVRRIWTLQMGHGTTRPPPNVVDAAYSLRQHAFPSSTHRTRV